tara:strand:+ start:307 stop:441 length:135 start_codon:yes stop_codon:yes gene_type:complete
MDDKIIERIKKLERESHPPVDWEDKINKLAKRVKILAKLISKRR